MLRRIWGMVAVISFVTPIVQADANSALPLTQMSETSDRTDYAQRNGSRESLDLAAMAVDGKGRPLFAQDTWTFQVYGSGTAGDEDKGNIYTGHIGFGYHFLEALSINLEGFGGWVTAERDDDGGVGGFDLLLRWHYLRGDDWSLYIDGGVGFQQATTNFPGDSHYDFRPQFGIGGTLRLDGDLFLMGGVRYMHISNGALTENNDGLDAAQFYLGVIVPF